MVSDEHDRIVTEDESDLASALIPPPQFYTERECRDLFRLNLVLVIGAVAVCVVTVNGGAFVGVGSIGINLLRFKKMERAIRAGGSFPKTAAAPRVPKRFELWIWPLLFALLTAGLFWLTKIDLLRWLLHPASSPVMFVFSVIALPYLFAGWLMLLWTVRREYCLHFAAKRAAKTTGTLDSLTVNETLARSVTVTVPGAQSETLARNSHWWTDTQSREEAKVIVKR